MAGDGFGIRSTGEYEYEGREKHERLNTRMKQTMKRIGCKNEAILVNSAVIVILD